MDINSREITELLEGIEQVRRRKIVDRNYSDITYIDPLNNISKVKIQNNNIISGRRGCGKTTILLSSIKENLTKTTITIDCQHLRTNMEDNIIIKLVIKIFQELYDDFNNNYYKQLVDKYKESKRIFVRKSEKTSQKDLEKGEVYLKLIEKIVFILEDFKKRPNEIHYKVNFENVDSLKNENRKESSLTLGSDNSVELGLGLKYNALGAKLQSIISIMANSSLMRQQTMLQESEMKITAEDIRVIKKSVLLNDLIEHIAYLFNQYKEITNKEISLYLDDFYQISHDKQVRILHYFHNIYKNCYDSSFCFKLCTLPNRLKLNYDKENILSAKDDFSTINLDRDLSEIDSVKQYLIQILCSIRKELKFQPKDIEQLFSNGALITLIEASGGIPRDFLLMFRDVVDVVRANNRNSIGKMDIYSVVHSMRKDKDENIEYDSNITLEMIEKAKQQILSEIVDKKNTNVFLFSNSEKEQNQALLRNLVNSRYLHIIKEATSSENKKYETFTAYLVDMSFYIKGKQMKRGFEARPFWKRDGKSRLKHIESAPIFRFK